MRPLRNTLRYSGVADSHVWAEVATSPLTSMAAFRNALTSLDPRLSQPTAETWRDLERNTVGSLPGYSVDEVVSIPRRHLVSVPLQPGRPVHRKLLAEHRTPNRRAAWPPRTRPRGLHVAGVVRSARPSCGCGEPNRPLTATGPDSTSRTHAARGSGLRRASSAPGGSARLRSPVGGRSPCRFFRGVQTRYPREPRSRLR